MAAGGKSLGLRSCSGTDVKYRPAFQGYELMPPPGLPGLGALKYGTNTLQSGSTMQF